MQSTETRPVAPPSGGASERRPATRPCTPRPTTTFQAILAGDEPKATAAGPGAVPKVRERRQDDGDERPGQEGGRSPLPACEMRAAPIRETFAVPTPPPTSTPDAAQVQSLAETMLRTLRIGGDGRGGHEARMQIGSGAWAGTSIRIALRDGRLTATITPGESGDPMELADRLAKALAARGAPVEAIEVG